MGSNPGLPEAFLGLVSPNNIVLLASSTGVCYDTNANAFRHFYDYPFTENRGIWASCVTPLSMNSSRKM